MDNGIGHALGFPAQAPTSTTKRHFFWHLKILHITGGWKMIIIPISIFPRRNLLLKVQKFLSVPSLYLSVTNVLKHNYVLSQSELDFTRDVIWQNFARGTDSADILQHLSSMVTRSQCYRLTYTHAEEAAAVLEDHFTCWPSCDKWQIGSPNCNVETISSAKVETVQIGCYMRHSGVQEVTLNGSSFLADSKGAVIHYLNPISSSIWKLLEEPMSLDEMTKLIYGAFPEIEQKKIRIDVEKLINNLVKRQLLYRST